ncbi:MAG: YfhO family protein [Lachnospiraceae bacterium]|nr:YfhO family protein [Lachnospiraceae bacterium]
MKIATSLRRFLVRRPYFAYTVLFFLVLCACFSCFWHRGLLPIYEIDGLGQYYPTFLYTGRTIREFFANLSSGGTFRFYDLNIGLGSDLIGTLNYYGFGDPLNLFALLTTAAPEASPYIFTFVYYLRLFLGGLFFLLYIRLFTPKSPASVIAALCYAFSGYAVFAGGMYVHYASVLFVFPLLLFGCERLFKKERGGSVLFIGAWYLGLLGFYFTYMCAAFLVIYCLVRLIALYGKDTPGLVFSGVLKCGCIFILGLLVASPILLPSVSAFLSSERSGASPLSVLANLSNYRPSLNRSFVWDANIMNSMRNYPVLLAALAVFFVPKTRRILQLRIAVTALFIALYLPVTAIVMNGFADPRDRWVFEAQFVLCVIFAVVCNEFMEGSAGIAPQRLVTPLMLFALLNIVTAFWYRYSGLGLNEKELYVTASEANEEMKTPIGASSVITEDDDLFRIDGNFTSGINARPGNYGMIEGKALTCWWFSVVNGNAQSFVDEATGVTNDWRSFGLQGLTREQTRAGVKYMILREGAEAPSFMGPGSPYYYSSADPVTGNFEPAETYEWNGEIWNVYKNPDFRGFAYLTNESGSTAFVPCEDCSCEGNIFTCKIPEDYVDKLAVQGADYKITFVTAIPYSDGWTANIGGKPASVVNNDRFLSVVPDEAGEDDATGFVPGDTIILTYESPMFNLGCLIAIIALFLMGAYEVFAMRRRVSQGT